MESSLPELHIRQTVCRERPERIENSDFWTYSHLEGDGHLLGFHFQYSLETKKLHTDELSAILEPFHVSRPSLLLST